jgi:hypothetical protein
MSALGDRGAVSSGAFVAAILIAVASLVALGRVASAEANASERARPRRSQVLVLLGLNGPAILENADQFSAVVEAVRRRGRSNEVDLIAVDSRAAPEELDQALLQVRPEDLVLIVAPSSSRDVERVAGLFETRFASVPLLLVSSTAPSIRKRFNARSNVHFATQDNGAIARAIVKGVNEYRDPVANPVFVCHEAQDVTYATDLAIQVTRDFVARAHRPFSPPPVRSSDTTCVQDGEVPTRGHSKGDCILVLIGSPSWFERERLALPSCRDVVLADGLVTEGVERILKQSASRSIWVTEPVCPHAGADDARGIVFWGRAAFPFLLTAFEPEPSGARLTGSLVGRRLAKLAELDFRLRKL